jgi:myo-inositol-1(or 4)-monophosphatase
MRSFLMDLANHGGRIAREHFAHVSLTDAQAKGHRDFVSHVDRLVEDAIIGRIRAHYPDHRILGEETSGSHPVGPIDEGPCWIIDPIDGTTNFLHGVPVFAISIAYCERGCDPRHAIVYDPMREETFIGERGAGLWLNRDRVHSSGGVDLGKALIAMALPFKTLDTLEDVMRVLAALQRRCLDHRRAGSAALDLAYVACGRLDGYWELGIHPWDTAAGELLVRCGGGAASDFRGRTDGLPQRRSIVAGASPALHAELLAAVGPLAPWLDKPQFAPSA